jgi:hypothetical protein
MCGFIGRVTAHYAGWCLLMSFLTDRKQKGEMKSCNGKVLSQMGEQ